MKEYNGVKYYTQGEAANLWNVARSTVWHKVKSGGVPAFDVFGRKMIREDFVQKVLNGNFELANGQFFKGWRGKRDRVTPTKTAAKERAERVAAKKAAKEAAKK